MIKVFTDGASRGNPGEAGIGIVVYDEGENILKTYREYIGHTTNNQAEYKALLKSLEIIKKIKEESVDYCDIVDFYSDSELMVKQIKFEYLVKEPELAVLNNKFHVTVKKTGLIYNIHHVQRALNKAADKLANEAIDQKNANISLF